MQFGVSILGLCVYDWGFGGRCGGSELADVVGFGFCFVQQQEDEEVLVPHTDLPENNHQPMEGSSRFL